MRRPKKTYQACLNPHEAKLVDDISRAIGCSKSAFMRAAVKQMCDRYDMAKR